MRDSEGVVHVASAASDHSVFASISIDGSKHVPGELGFDSDGKAKYVYVYGNTKPFDLATLDAEVSVTMYNDPYDAGTQPTSMPFAIDADNTTLIKDTYSNLGITGVELKLAISDMYEVEHEVKPSLSFDPSGGTWADGGTDVRKYDAGLESEFEVIGAPKRDGYTFVCWKGSEYQPGQKYHADSDHVFTAQWKTNEGENPSGSDSGTGDKGGSDAGTGDKGSTNTSGSGNSATNAQKTSTNSTSKTPSTGDPIRPMLLPLLLMASGGVLAVIVGKRIREL